MAGEAWKYLVGVGVFAAVAAGLSQPAQAQFQFAAAQLVHADGGPIEVPGYSVPSLADWNNDGLLDLIVGEGSGTTPAKVRYYLNSGTTNVPRFTTYEYAKSMGDDLICPGSGCLGVYPRVVNWDEDGRKDLLLGQADGRVMIFLNINTDADPRFDAGTYLMFGQPEEKIEIDVEGRATANVLDWNNDGLKDLVVGARYGEVRYYLNEGTNAAPDFLTEHYVQENGGDLDVPTDRSSPVIADFDGDGRKDLLTGNTEGQILFYSNVNTDADPTFAGHLEVQAAGVPIDLPSVPRSRPFVGDWNDDGQWDLFIGSESGFVRWYRDLAGLGDTDNDGDVDLDDFDELEYCWAGPDQPLSGDCATGVDMDNSGTADLADFAILQQTYTGS